MKLSQCFGTSGGPTHQDSYKIQELERLRIAAQLNYEKHQATLSGLKKLSRDQLKRTLSISYPSKFDDILNKLASDEQKLTALKQEFASAHPEVKKAQAVVDLIKKQLDERIDGVLTGLETQLKISNDRIEDLQNQLAKARGEQPEKSLQARLSEMDEQTKSVSSPEDQEIARIKAMIKDSPDLINALREKGNSLNDLFAPLHTAASNGQLATAEFLLANGADVNRRSSRNQTPLYLATENGHRAMVELLIVKGAEVDARSLNQIPLHKAAEQGFMAVAQVLLQNKADVNAKNSVGGTPLHQAVIRGHKAVAELLLENGANINAKDNDGRTPLFAAPNLEMAKFLVENKADVNTVANEGWMSLHSAVQTGQLKLVELLLQNGANLEAKLSARNFEGKTPLHLAGNQKEIVELLLKSGANPNSTDALGATPLHYTANRKQEIAELLLAHKGDVNAKTAGGDTPLFWAVRNGNETMVEFLLAHKADPNLPNSKQETPLGHVNSRMIEATRANPGELNKWKEIGNLLIKHGADKFQQRRTQISVTRNHEQIYPIFKREMNSWNRFSILEAFGIAYELRSQSQGGPWYFKETGFPFPNLARVKIHRLEGNAEREILVDLEAILKSGDCSKDIWLEWGDVIEVPEKDHKLGEAWYGFSKELLETLPKCLEQTISISVKDEITPIVLEPKLKLRNIVTATNIVAATNEDSLGVQGLDFWLNDAISSSRLLRSSSDKTRVKVTRIDPVTKKSKQQIFNLKYLYPHNNLWLRDGDQIEIPERDSNSSGDF